MKQNRETLIWLLRIIGRRRYSIILLTLLSSALALIGLAYAWLFRSLIDSAVAGDRNALIRTALTLLAALAAQIVLGALNRFLSEEGSAEIENRLKSNLFERLLNRDYASVTAVHSAEWMNRLTADTSIVASHAISFFPFLISTLVRLVGALVMLIVLAPVFAAVLIPGGMFLVVVTFFFRKILKRLQKDIRESDGALRIFLQEHLISLMVLRAFGQEQRTLMESKKRMKDHKYFRMRRTWFSNLCSAGFSVVMTGVYIGSAIYCAFGILGGSLSYGSMVAILQLVTQAQGPFAGISGVLPQYYSMLACAERIREADTLPEDTAGTRRKLEQLNQFYDHDFRGIAFREVSFSYPLRNGEAVSGGPVITDCSLFLGKGTYTCLLGPSGCGKSTLFKLLMCFYSPDSGKRVIITQDGEVPLDSSWRGLFAYVPQGNQLMSGTIREAVSFGEVGDTSRDAEIRQALYLACADAFVRELPKGLDTVLGESGSGLSEGQLQRLAIARAVFSGCPILLLDEATSALDEATEAELLLRLRQMTNQTVLFITHRKSALNIADQIVECQERNDAFSWSINPHHSPQPKQEMI